MLCLLLEHRNATVIGRLGPSRRPSARKTARAALLRGCGVGIPAGDDQNIIAIRATIFVPDLNQAGLRLCSARYEFEPFVLGIHSQTSFGIALCHHQRGRTLPRNFLPAHFRENRTARDHVGDCF
jgi:hypothetical protein